MPLAFVRPRPGRGHIAPMLLLALVVASPARALVVNVTYDSSVTTLANAAVITGAFNSVAAQFNAAITNPVTVNINVAWGKVNTTALVAGDVGETLVNAAGFYTYAQVKGFLAGTGATLPASDPTGQNRYLIPDAEAKALALSGLTYPSFDAYIGFSSSLGFSFDDSVGVAAGTYDFKAVAQHEIAHALGRETSLNTASPFYAYAADVFRYSAPGASSFTRDTPVGGTPAYASTDGGVTKLGTYADQTTTGDRSDWQLSANTRNAQTALLSSGKDYCLSTADQRLLQALGWLFSEAAADLFRSGPDCAPTDASASAYATIAAPAPSPSPSVAAPEPASLSLLACGVGVLPLLRRRRRDKRR